jgi:hypothetical protein
MTSGSRPSLKFGTHSINADMSGGAGLGWRQIYLRGNFMPNRASIGGIRGGSPER